ncbi:MAG: exopolysaccharide biosynthesis polyprenyl glycosylphosphotransferase [candidate division WOR-3 bacterium]|nr:exopolysaccharide biosynthesis polyprenyl glycosylphosphotransferase [candidate division WOR-3 bacterium]
MNSNGKNAPESAQNSAAVVALELLFLLLIIAILRLIFSPNSTGATTVLMIWLLLTLASYLVGEFESATRINYGLTTRTQAAFALTFVTYGLVHQLWSWCEELTIAFWLAFWTYLTFIAPLVGILIRRMFPQQVLFVTDFNQDKRQLLRWWGFDCAETIPIDALSEWLHQNAEPVGRVSRLPLIVIDTTDLRTEQLVSTLAPCYFIDFIGVRSFRMSAYLLGPHPRLLGPFAHEGINRRLKRLIDIFISATALLVLSPLMLLVALLIKLTSPGPVFYRHRRLGRNMRPFGVLKFRTMFVDADRRLEEILRTDPEKRAEFEKTFKLKNDPRVTSIGRFLRRTSLDELPQLLNVLAGQMSLVGPRPIVEKEIQYYQDYSLLLFRVPPGLTGLWQVSGRTDTTYDERVRLDTRYVREWTIWGDLLIILRTVPAVLARKGAY